jgi:polar amino acid transport system ATP-binding protein
MGGEAGASMGISGRRETGFVDQSVVLSASGVHKWLGANHVLRGVELEVRRREIIVMIGPSGSGKSTLLRCINHLEPIDAGQIAIEGDLVGYFHKNGELLERSERDVARTRRKIGMVFQQFNLFQHMTALENIAYGPQRVLGLSTADAQARAVSLLQRVGLEGFAGSHPSRLSGGQQQRVAIARALAMEPKLMLFDEPTSSLDPELVGDVLRVMMDVAEQGMTMIVVTHEMDFARQVGDTLVVMDGGVIIERGPCADVIREPKHPRTASFLSSVRRNW